MKLAEALLTRGILQNKTNELGVRLGNVALIQEGEEPAENPEKLLSELDSTLKELETLVTRINITNASVTSSDGRSLTAMLSERDSLRSRISILRSFLDAASATGRRARGSEIRIVSSVPVKELQKSLDEYSQALRQLEVRIQELNWTTELM